jgi:hypothetical protein
VSGLEGLSVRDVLQEMINKDSLFEGTATELLNTLNARIGNRIPLPQSWPKSAKGSSSQLRRLAPALRSIGIEIEFPKRHGQAKVVRIFASQSSHASQSKDDQSTRRDAKGDANSTRDANNTEWDASEDELSHWFGEECDDGTQWGAKLQPNSEDTTCGGRDRGSI